MPKNPRAHNAVGYRGPSGSVFADNDDRLLGMGSPPSDPDWQNENPGAGSFPMQRQLVGVDEIDEQRRPPESKWILKPASQRTGISINIDEPASEPEPDPA